MLRETAKDFISLQNYVKNYSLTTSLEDANFQELCKEMHAKYYALVTFSSELTSGDSRGEIEIYGTPVVERILESISDVGSSTFCWLHGAYKPGRMMLRSSIENMVRAIGSIESKNYLLEKNIFNLFETAKNSGIFNSEQDIRTTLNSLNADYGLLCADVHTANEQNMASISSLADFPKFDPVGAEAFKGIWIRVVKNLISALCLTFKSFINKLHHTNKKILIDALPKEHRPTVQGLNKAT